MKQNDFSENEKDKRDNNNKANLERTMSKEQNSNIKTIRESSYAGSSFFKEEYPSIDKESYFKGLGLIFIYFSVIIYSLLYMLTPDKKANLFFDGDLKSPSYNHSIYNENYDFYKLDTIRERVNNTILELSRNYLSDNKKISDNHLLIKIIYSENPKIINKIIIINNQISKEIDNGIQIYHYFKIKDFPFCLSLFNKDNEDILDITSDYLKNFSFGI